MRVTGHTHWTYWIKTPEMSKEEWQRKNSENWDMWEKVNGKVKLINVKN